MSQRPSHPTAVGSVRMFGNLKVMTAAALLCSLSIIFGKYLAFNITESIRFSLENLPILLAGLLFGPWVGAVVGVAADLIGCMLVGYTPIPLVTVGAACIGLLSGLLAWYIYPRDLHRLGTLAVFLPILSAHAVGSVGIKSVGLAHFTGMPLAVTVGWRALNYVIIGLLEGAIILLLAKNKLFMGELLKLTHKKGAVRKHE